MKATWFVIATHLRKIYFEFDNRTALKIFILELDRQ